MRIENAVDNGNKLGSATKTSKEIFVKDELSTVNPRVPESFGQNASLCCIFYWQEGEDVFKNIIRDMIKDWMVGSNSCVVSRVSTSRVNPANSFLRRLTEQ